MHQFGNTIYKHTFFYELTMKATTEQNVTERKKNCDFRTANIERGQGQGSSWEKEGFTPGSDLPATPLPPVALHGHQGDKEGDVVVPRAHARRPPDARPAGVGTLLLEPLRAAAARAHALARLAPDSTCRRGGFLNEPA